MDSESETESKSESSTISNTRSKILSKKEIVLMIVPLVVGAILGSAYIPMEAAIVYYTTPSPTAPFNPIPANGSHDIGLHQNLSWEGVIPESDIMSLMLKLSKQESGLKIIYNIDLGESPDKLNINYMKYEDYKLHTTDIRIPLKPDKEYYWRVTAKNSINNDKIAISPIWKFQTIRSPIINISESVSDSVNIPPQTENATGKLERALGIDEKFDAVNISYNLTNSKGYINFKNPITGTRMNELIGTRGLSFSYMGGGNPNTLELKLAYNNGVKNVTTFNYRWPGKTLADRWVNMTVLYNTPPDIHGGIWNNYNNVKRPSDFDISQLTSIDFAISCIEAESKGGSGWIKLGNVKGIV